MKKKAVITFVAMIVLIGLGYLGFNVAVRQKESPTHLSFDREVEIVFEGATSMEVEEEIYGLGISFAVVDPSLFLDLYVRESADISILSELSTPQEDEAVYLLEKDKHVFFLSLSSQYVLFADTCFCLFTEECMWIAPAPCIRISLGKEGGIIPWGDLLGYTDFESVLTYYSNIPDTRYRVDETGKKIYLDGYLSLYEDGIWFDDALLLSFSEEGVEVIPLLEDSDIEDKIDSYGGGNASN